MTNTFVNAIGKETTTTTNGMTAYKSTGNACLELFFKFTSQDKEPVWSDVVSDPTGTLFGKAYAESRETAILIAQWIRDIRGGAGSRKAYRDILTYLELIPTAEAQADLKVLLDNTPVIGRFDDLLVVKTDKAINHSHLIIAKALSDMNALCAKWMPRKGLEASRLRKFLKLERKQYRKLLVALSDTVETKLCRNDLNQIEYGHVPSKAFSKYTKTFSKKDTERFSQFLSDVSEGKNKINASAIFPHDVLKPSGFLVDGPRSYKQLASQLSQQEIQAIIQQWKALPDYMTDDNVLPMIDVSGSMTWVKVAGSTPLEVSMSLGVYVAERNKGAFKNKVMTFSSTPEFVTLAGNVLEKICQVGASNVQGSTNIEAALNSILDLAVKNDVAKEDMPKTLMIFSDMQFDRAVMDSSMGVSELIKTKFEAAGYDVPGVVFWNLTGSTYENSPAQHDSKGVALVGGYSPAILKSILSKDLTKLSPIDIMMSAISNPRYKTV